MNEFQGKVAVVTGAASGIGRGIAERCVLEGMRVVLADVEEEVLSEVADHLRSNGAEVVGVRTDVSKASDVEALAQATLSTFGAVHLLFNNAGVGTGPRPFTTIWNSTLEDWQWVIGVNLWGVIHGVRVFVPIMLAQDTECHIVNTASIAGLLPIHRSAPYQVTKHAVVGLSEHLYFSLAQQNAKIKASVLCPGWVKTRILESARNRPAELQNPKVEESISQAREAATQETRKALEAGISPQEAADHVFRAIREEQFYVLTHPELDSRVRKRMEDILDRRNPS